MSGEVAAGGSGALGGAGAGAALGSAAPGIGTGVGAAGGALAGGLLGLMGADAQQQQMAKQQQERMAAEMKSRAQQLDQGYQPALSQLNQMLGGLK